MQRELKEIRGRNGQKLKLKAKFDKKANGKVKKPLPNQKSISSD